MSHLSQQPSNPVYHVVDCRISNHPVKCKPPHKTKTRTTIKMWNPETILIFPLVLDDPPWLLLVLEML